MLVQSPAVYAVPLGQSGLEIWANMAWNARANLAWISGLIWPGNQGKSGLEILPIWLIDPEILNNPAWKVLANLAWNPCQYG